MSTRTLVILLALAAAASGCVNAPDDAVEAASAGDALALVGPLTDVVDGSIQVSAAASTRAFNFGGAFSFPIEVGGNLTGYVVELEWAAAAPASEKLSLWVRDAATGSIPPTSPTDLVEPAAPVAQVSGTSPLRLALDVSAFPEAGDYNILVRAAAEPAGAAVEQPFTLHITQFAGIAFEESFSALGAGSNETA